MKVTRRFTKVGQDPFSSVEYDRRTSRISNPDGSIVFSQASGHTIRRIDPKGERFDHNFHQAVFEAERPDAPAGTVIEVLQPGYVVHDRLLRPAMVGVAKAPAKPSEGTDDAA